MAEIRHFPRPAFRNHSSSSPSKRSPTRSNGPRIVLLPDSSRDDGGRSRIGNKLQRLANEAPYALAVIERWTDLVLVHLDSPCVRILK